MRFLTWTFRLLAFLFLFVFALRNTVDVSLDFFLVTWELPLSLLLLIALVLGVVLGALAMLKPFFRARREAARLRGELEQLASADRALAPPAPDVAPDSPRSGFSVFPFWARRKS
ncbi:MAG: lipopolysaccharide assembly protein LapA domain-containing protein [Betaproteobacteria bacterium]|nr:lipopolysaccharide assembly protein LapA domain-containing protein [Betaproteobacteria bacterium]